MAGRLRRGGSPVAKCFGQFVDDCIDLAAHGGDRCARFEAGELRVEFFAQVWQRSLSHLRSSGVSGLCVARISREQPSRNSLIRLAKASGVSGRLRFPFLRLVGECP